VPGEGLEPPTNGLQNRCSTAELTRHQAHKCGISALFKRGRPPFGGLLLPPGGDIRKFFHPF
jgi:hypothetical protein